MRRSFRHLLTCSLLATYASIAFLGEGLHWLTPDEHHHGTSLVVSSESDAPHNAGESHAPTDKRVTATRGIDDDHDCEICDFLAQAVSQQPQIATTPDFAVLVADFICPSSGLYSSITLGLHAPRGPPQLSA